MKDTDIIELPHMVSPAGVAVGAARVAMAGVAPRPHHRRQHPAAAMSWVLLVTPINAGAARYEQLCQQRQIVLQTPTLRSAPRVLDLRWTTPTQEHCGGSTSLAPGTRSCPRRPATLACRCPPPVPTKTPAGRRLSTPRVTFLLAASRIPTAGPASRVSRG